MARPPLEVSDIVRLHRDDFVAFRGGRLSGAEGKVLGDIVSCRTAAQGGHLERCDGCGHERVAYNSCRNRHCPKCQSNAREAWLADREKDLLPVEYFHVVFTIPHQLSSLAHQNKVVVYDILCRTAAQTLLRVAADHRHLGARIGVLTALHTWGQTLELHPHVHCVVPGGGISSDRKEWVSCRPGFLLPVRVLARLFRGLFLDALSRAFDQERLSFFGELADLRDPSCFRTLLKPLYREDWIVYAKPPFGGPEHVLRYLSRYTHRVAISNRRLVALTEGQVSFRWKDYAHGCQQRVMTLSAVEFLRRFLLHILPRGFVRIRQYGFLANRCRKQDLALARELLGTPPDDEKHMHADEGTPVSAPMGPKCPLCGEGVMVVVLLFQPGAFPNSFHPEKALIDTS